jgi:proliferating cell nuclear antigen
MIEFRVPVAMLQHMFRPVIATADEFRLNITPEGLSTRLVDPANVLSVDFSLPRECFSSWQVDETFRVGIDSTDYKKAFHGIEPLEGTEDATVTITTKPYSKTDSPKIVIKVGPYVYEVSTLDPDSIRKEPVILTFKPTAEVTMPFLQFKDAVQRAHRLGDYVTFSAERVDSQYAFRILAGEDHVKLDGTFTNDMDGVLVAIEQDARSLHSLDYLTDIVSVNKEKSPFFPDTVTLFLKSDFPVQIRQNILRAGSATFMLAPRIESE